MRVPNCFDARFQDYPFMVLFPRTLQEKEVPHKSIVVWPDTISVGNVEGKNESVDTHPSKGAAEAVCAKLRKEGFGGDKKVFPLSTRVEPV
jgi:hypothetical protein